MCSFNAVLSTLAGKIEDVTITIGEAATFVCNILTYDTDYNIVWRISNVTYNVTYNCVDGIHCSVNESHSVLHVDNTESLGPGSYRVLCTLRQILPANFTTDGSFLAEFGNDIVREGTLHYVKPCE